MTDFGNISNDAVKENHGEARDIKLLLYSHDTMGLGHFRRNIKIAQALKSTFPDIRLIMITGSPLADNAGIENIAEIVKLPPVVKIDSEKYDSAANGVPYADTLKQRTELILNTVKNHLPDIVLIDHAPLGMKREILPALRWQIFS